MDQTVTLRIITPRNDGCFVNVVKLANGKLKITMVSTKGTIVDEQGEMEPAELFDWIESRTDW